MKNSLRVKTIACVCDARRLRWNNNNCAIEKITAAPANSTRSETFLSNVTRENECNFYDSDVGETSEASMDAGPRP